MWHVSLCTSLSYLWTPMNFSRLAVWWLNDYLFFIHWFGRAGIVIAYAANQNLSDQLKGVRRLVNSNMKDLQTLVNQTPVVCIFYGLFCEHFWTLSYSSVLYHAVVVMSPCLLHEESRSLWLTKLILFQQIDYLIGQYAITKGKVISDLDSKRCLSGLTVRPLEPTPVSDCLVA